MKIVLPASGLGLQCSAFTSCQLCQRTEVFSGCHTWHCEKPVGTWQANAEASTRAGTLQYVAAPIITNVMVPCSKYGYCGAARITALLVMDLVAACSRAYVG